MKKKTKVRRPLIQLGMFARINLYSTAIVLVVLILICVLLTNNLIYPGLQKDKLLNEEASNQLSKLIAEKYAAVFNQSKLLHTSEHVAFRIHEFSVSNEPFFSYEDIRFISNYLTAVRYGDEDILDAMIIPIDEGNIFFTSSQATRRADVGFHYSSLEIIQDLIASDHNISVIYSAEQPYLVPSQTQMITFAIKIFNSKIANYEEPIGIMLINYPLSVFSDAYQKLGDLSGGSVYVVNRDKDIIFSTEHHLLGQHYDESLLENAEVSTKTISTSGMQLISVMPLDALHSATNDMIRILLYILVPSMLFIVFMVFLFIRQYRKRLDSLSEAMQSYTSDGAQVPIAIHHHDELAKLAEQFNKMCERLDQQIKMHYQAEVGRKTAELNALQAQINPHFLYNTIESIRMCAIEEGNLDVSEMLMQLGQIFHWMIQLDKRIVYLEDEIEYNEAYLSLQKLRYEDSFESEIIASDEALYLGVPKFTLQPIIENALLHGLKENGLSGLIAVKARVEQDILVVQVSDNGSGMDPESLQRLQRHITGQESNPKFGIGMQNVHSRIQMLFGGDYGIKVWSAPEQGTTVTITLPAVAKKEMEKTVEQETQGDDTL